MRWLRPRTVKVGETVRRPLRGRDLPSDGCAMSAAVLELGSAPAVRAAEAPPSEMQTARRWLHYALEERRKPDGSPHWAKVPLLRRRRSSAGRPGPGRRPPGQLLRSLRAAAALRRVARRPGLRARRRMAGGRLRQVRRAARTGRPHSLIARLRRVVAQRARRARDRPAVSPSRH